MKRGYLVFFVFLAIFLAFFLQYPLNHSLTGDIDGIGNLAMYKQLKLAIDGWFSSAPVGTVCYPSEKVWVYFGSDFGIGIIHVALNYLGFNDLWAHYIFISLLFALNSFSLYLLLKLLFKHTSAALFGGLLFSFAQFTLGNLENPNTLVFFLSFLSLYYYFKSLDPSSHSMRFFAVAVFLGVIQIYLSPYNFLYHSIVWGILILAYEFKNLHVKTLKKYVGTAIVYLIVIFPFIRFYLFHDDLQIDPRYVMTPEIASKLGLAVSDYLRCLPNHLYMGDSHIELHSWTGRIKAAYLGIAFYLFALVGIMKGSKRKISFTLIVVGLIMAAGPFIQLSASGKFPNLTLPLYEHMNFGNVFRITSRGFFISLIGLTFAATSGWIVMRKYRFFIPLFLLSVFAFAENISWPMHTYDHEHILQPDEELVSHLRSVDQSVMLSLPSSLFDYDGTHREYVYMYWQYFHRQNTPNGSVGFFPVVRTRLNDLLITEDEEDLRTALKEFNVDQIVFHKDLASQNDLNILNKLKGYDFLNQMMETDRSVVFERNL